MGGGGGGEGNRDKQEGKMKEPEEIFTSDWRPLMEYTRRVLILYVVKYAFLIVAPCLSTFANLSREKGTFVPEQSWAKLSL